MASFLAVSALSSGLTTTLALAADAARGAAIVNSRSQGLCLLCHRGPGVPEHLQGTLAPDLAGAGSRWTADELRQRLREPQRFNPDSIMPAYGRVADAGSGLQRVAPAWRGKPLLDAQQIEDVVAYLGTLK
ncbi:sulfur oxidation c-type cytochrome SoxX [Aquabacterium sp.]|uniref:sulfur oxidation c-type cytochrome SoxX n=1 Tax=Aquabacterium sp. TaxID=1872578 RepID=UPI002CD91011|nr:sulfur oxidation c-type cytochrome SoxX [Aquabacterium sp.]HSW02999.1 sulfur oxidation c-type cytochrome SoxX [Aquabacterium sp.]